MVYVIVSKTPSKNLINFIKENIKPHFEYKIFYFKDFIIENQIPKITKRDIILWEPIIAYYNLEFLKLHNSVVLLERQTVLLQKVSKLNPVNENMAINHGFYVLYLTDEKDITNEEWNLIVKKREYLLEKEQLNQLIKDTL
jgi:hypothetical protein